MTRSHCLKNNRPTIAILTNTMATPFTEGIIFGAVDFAKQHNFNTLCFSGSEFAKHAPTDMSRHRIFELIDLDLIDGMIIPIGSLSRFISSSDHINFLEKFSSIPIITINSNVPGYIDIGFSADKGMFDLVKHLHIDHSIRRFAFAGVTGTHRSTELKKQCFIKALASYGITFDEKLHITSNMYRNAPLQGLQELISGEPNSWPEAIVAATSGIAKDVIAFLSRRNIRVPQDIVVTGCMGQSDELFTVPPLTSIIEPTYDLGWNAAKYVVAAIEGHPYTESLEIPTALTIRNSCGCHSRNTTLDQDFLCDAVAINKQGRTSLPNIKDIFSQLQAVIDGIPSDLKAFIEPNTAKKLATLFLNDVTSQSSTNLISYLHETLECSLKSDIIFVWGQLAFCIHKNLMPMMASTNSHAHEVKLAHAIFQIVQTCTEKAGIYRSSVTKKYVGVLREIGIQLNSEFNLDEITFLLAQDLQITDCYISIFDKQNTQATLASSIMAVKSSERLNTSDAPYTANQLIPPSVSTYTESFAFFVMPLSFQQDSLGFCVMSIGDRHGVVYESLLTLFSSALKNKIYVNHLIEAERKFSDIAHSASDWLWEIDTQAKFTYCSDGVAQVLGYTPNELISKSIDQLLMAPNSSYGNELMNAMLVENNLTDHESLYRHKNGSERTLLATGKPIYKANTIVGYRGAYKDISKVKVQEERIRKLAYYDQLTNQLNRTSFNNQLDLTVKQSQKKHSKFAVLFIDLDGFKLINDSMGHDAGDSLLYHVAQLFSQCIREEDTLARFGGDEFAILVPNNDNELSVKNVAQRITEKLSAPIKVLNKPFYITASIGIAEFPKDGSSAKTLLLSADKAMYYAKQNGKNRFSFYEKELENKLDNIMSIKNLLHTALREDKFHLLFQPLVNTESREVCAIEALIRLSKMESDTPLVGPAEFIPLAEEIGLIDQIGQWVFYNACKQQRKLEKLGLTIRCSINVSAKQFYNPNMANGFIKIVQDLEISPEAITIEITENAIIDNEESARAMLQQLSDFGISIALDDFGTGYASLSYLQKIPVDILKIDRSFVSDCTTNNESANIISAIIMMAKSLKLKVVAEGVETEEQFNFLQKLGCDTIQGYLFSSPIKGDAILEFIEKAPYYNTTGPYI